VVVSICYGWYDDASSAAATAATRLERHGMLLSLRYLILKFMI
jgi:hypothetical protein